MTMADDHAELASLMHEFLRAVSFEAGAHPNYDDLHDLFTETGTLTRTMSGTPETATVSEFIASRWAAVDSGELTSFYERELSDITESFGNVAHRFSTYEKRGTTESGPIAALGAISTQFVRTTAGWRMSAMVWDDERPGLELAPRYRA
jgi:hypothetical protein